MTATEYVTYDPTDAVFWLTPEQAAVLADDTSPAGLAGLFHAMSEAWTVFGDVTEAFRAGGGVTLDRYPAAWWDGMERFTGTWFHNLLSPEWIPAADGVADKRRRRHPRGRRRLRPRPRLDFKVADRLEHNIGRIPAMFHGFSLTYCLPTSLAHDGEALGTCGLPESEVRTRCDKAGFATVDVVPFDNPFNVLYQAKA